MKTALNTVLSIGIVIFLLPFLLIFSMDAELARQERLEGETCQALFKINC